MVEISSNVDVLTIFTVQKFTVPSPFLGDVVIDSTKLGCECTKALLHS